VEPNETTQPVSTPAKRLRALLIVSLLGLAACGGAAKAAAPTTTAAPTTAAPTTAAPPTTEDIGQYNAEQSCQELRAHPEAAYATMGAAEYGKYADKIRALCPDAIPPSTTAAPTTVPPTTTVPMLTAAQIKAALLPNAQAYAADFNDNGQIDGDGNFAEQFGQVLSPLMARIPANLGTDADGRDVYADFKQLAQFADAEHSNNPADTSIVTMGDTGAFDTQAQTAVKFAGVPLVATVDDGTYTVGQDIQPGTYVAKHSVEGCYWERQNANGDIIANNFINSANRVQVTIRKGDYGFDSEGCGPWIKTG
jgi:hypothetical protein